MSNAREHVEQWRAAGVIDETAAGRILAFEAGQRRELAAERPSFTEVLIYLGVAIIAVGVVILSATNWQHMESWARVAVPGVPAAAAIVAGWFMRRQEHPGVRRGGLAVWAAATGLVAGTSAVALNEAGVREEDNVLVTGLVMLAVALGFWLRERSHLQAVAVAAAGVVLSFSAAAETSRASERWAGCAAGLTMLALGVVAVALAERGLVRPRVTGRLLGALAIAFGSFFASAGTPLGLLEALPFAAGAGLVVLSVRAGFFPYAVLGVLAVFVGTLISVTRHISDTTLVALSLMLTGAVLIAVVVLLARMRQRGTGPSPRGGGTPRVAGI